MDINAVSSGIAAMQGLVGISRTLLEVRDITKLAGIQFELNQRILDVQAAMFDLQAKFQAKSDAFEALKAHATQLESAARDRERYTLHEIRAGAFVYRRREDVQPTEPIHYLCQPCFDKGVKAILEAQDSGVYGELQICPVCDRKIAMST